MAPQTGAIEPTLKPPKSGVTVRMYNVGFGDCFLLAFRAEAGRAHYMLIDCGVHTGVQGGEARLQKVVADIAKATANHLHVVVVTHEHWDHLAGFYYARSYFEPMQIDELWLAWPENPDDKDAKRLKDVYGKRIKALTAAVQELKQTKDPVFSGYSTVVESILGFDEGALQAGERSNEAQYKFLRCRSKNFQKEAPPYLEPGKPPLTLQGVKGVNIHVLGPSRDIESIKETGRRKETNMGPVALDDWSGFSLGALTAQGEDKLEDEDKEAYLRSLPFEKNSPYRILPEDLKKDKKYLPFFERHYGFAHGKDDGPAWRRIETDWLNGALEIALRINDYVNNTSLVLAIELTDSERRKVLLFVGDAQVGNWRSWASSCADLIQRTAFYKVGHHGSQNATLTDQVEKMSGDLVAMISVDQDWAKSKAHWQDIPARGLLDELGTKTKGRVFRTDKIPPEKPDKADYVKEWQDFTNEHIERDPSMDKLWIQYTVQG